MSRKKRINSRAKGKNGELELSHFLTRAGFAARRGQQFNGGPGSPDVVCEGLSGIHLEVKRVEAGNLYNWLEQSVRDAGSKLPIVAHRRSNRPWVVIMRLDDFLTQFAIKDM